MHVVDPDEEDDEEKCTVVVSLMQKDGRKLRIIQKTDDNGNQAIGFDLLKVCICNIVIRKTYIFNIYFIYTHI